ncbi:hypothetical protein C6A86_028875 [Mycobacterium sp. ITM-2016-00316]|uniref:hypothetical protein n=1 Tax=Mycobacterium sp. ITM-2016-00316 TaxID=2099695 RepID=UPI00115BE61B|nr:hypothetical protein [Mycobacterium sp. ITM-2016-00316]WNG82100.1 hypothetical protein C6A86_028875 [Mycobacterium sp. ITM-2016-00316]
MGAPKVGASVLLLLAVGPLLLLAPWWPLPSLVVAPLVALAAVYTAVIFALSCRWWAKRKRELTVSASPSECRAQWQAGRWDIDPRHAYLANVGDATAYDVTVTLSDKVVCTAETVPPFSAERLSSSSGLPCYVNLSIRQRLGASAAMTKQSRDSGNAVPESSEFDVQVRWRTAFGEWHTQSAVID